jgi:hypothetical protein
MLTPKFALSEDGFGWDWPFKENGAALRAEFARLIKTEPV